MYIRDSLGSTVYIPPAMKQALVIFGFSVKRYYNNPSETVLKGDVYI